MKHIIILGDGMADWPVKSLGDKTLLQYAKTPYMDKLARMGRNGRLITVAEGFHPGSEVANMSVLGYNLPKVYEGRGPLEAASIGVDLKPGEMAMRCNLICVEGEILKNHSSGHISTEEADVLIQYLQEKLGNDRVRFHTGVQYRHLLVIKGGNKELDCTPPHDVPLKPFRPLMVKPLVPEAQETADLINDLILKSQELLKDHPLNLKRMAEGNLDKRAVGPIYEAVKDWDEPVAIAVLPDHPTPCELRTHTSDPIPFLIWYPGIEPDEVQMYDEIAACNGSYGLLKEDEFIKEFMK